MSGGSIASAHKGVGGGGGRWARAYTSKWRVESRYEIIRLYWLLSGLYTAKTTQKTFANYMSPCIHLPLILVKPGPSQAMQILPFKPVTALRKNVC